LRPDKKGQEKKVGSSPLNDKKQKKKAAERRPRLSNEQRKNPGLGRWRRGGRGRTGKAVE